MSSSYGCDLRPVKAAKPLVPAMERETPALRQKCELLTKEGGERCTRSIGSLHADTVQRHRRDGAQYGVQDGHPTAESFTSICKQQVSNCHMYFFFNPLNLNGKYMHHLL
jgi:hypothetical protein